MMHKRNLRKKVLDQLIALRQHEKDYIQSRLYQFLFESSFWRQARILATTSSTHVEWDTKPIIHRAWKEGKIVALPKTDPREKSMNFYQICSFEQLEVGHYQIAEPIVEACPYIKKDLIDLLIVPGLVFDRKGYRIGYGGGYYDRFLQDLDAVTVSLLATIQLLETIPVEAHDLPVEYLITEAGILDTGKK